MFTAQTLLSNIAIASLIGGLAWMVGRSGRRARLAHLLWVGFFIKLITPPLLVLPVIPVHSNGSPGVDWWIGLGCVWLAGFAYYVARGMVRSVRFHLLLRRQGVDDPESTAFVTSLIGAKYHSQGPQVVRLPLRLSPMLFGFSLRPVIVYPEPLWAVLSESERHAFLAHETAHYCRRDHLVRWLEWLVGCIYWWFPGVHFAHHQLERHEEACCDAWAIARLDSTPRQYAEALLRVVDYLSEHSIGIPRFANGMRPTDSLEERIRMLMCTRGKQPSSQPLNLIVGAGCAALILVHPTVRTVQTVVTEPARTHQLVAGLPGDNLETLYQSTLTDTMPSKLPEPPRGFWNQPSPRRWATFALSLPGATLIADVDRGIRIDSTLYPPIIFSPEEVSAIVEIPATQRVVIGTSAGTIRLWDLTAGMPVSLIGQHASGVTSVAYHGAAGLVSSDQAGTVNRWDLQSGQILASWTDPDTAIQCIRYANDGSTMMILTGRWGHCGNDQQVHLVDSHSLQTIRSVPVHCAAAVVMDRDPSGWVVVDWSGNVRQLESEMFFDTLSKNEVSSLVLSQNTHLTAEDVE